jgi:hypothetical protein
MIKNVWLLILHPSMTARHYLQLLSAIAQTHDKLCLVEDLSPKDDSQTLPAAAECNSETHGHWLKI